MKSLEIVNEEIEMRKGGILNDAEWNRLKKLETIKQDLEVLEILRKKRVNIDYLYCLYTWYRDYNYDNPIIYTLEKYNDQLEFNRQITQEELTKIKQWLEENE